MGKIADRDGRDQLRRRTPAEYLDLVGATDGDVGKFPVLVVREIDVIRNRSGIQQCLLFQREAWR